MEIKLFWNLKDELVWTINHKDIAKTKQQRADQTLGREFLILIAKQALPPDGWIPKIQIIDQIIVVQIRTLVT